MINRLESGKIQDDLQTQYAITTMLKLLFLSSLLVSSTVLAEKRQDAWELGVGAIGVDIPYYPGASQNDSLLVPFPFLRVQTEYFEVDEGIRGFFYESPDIRLNISGDLGIPVNSQDSLARAGMPDLNTVVQIGPSLEIIFAGGRRQASEFRLELPVRTAIASDLKHTENIGWIIEPRLTYETLRPYKSGFAYQVSSGVRYATSDFHEYYYDVPVSFATETRPAFESSSGYSGFFMDLVGNWRQKNIIYFAFLRYQNLSGAEFDDSPLVEQDDYVSIGVGIAWVIAGSHFK